MSLLQIPAGGPGCSVVVVVLGRPHVQGIRSVGADVVTKTCHKPGLFLLSYSRVGVVTKEVVGVIETEAHLHVSQNQLVLSPAIEKSLNIKNEEL